MAAHPRASLTLVYSSSLSTEQRDVASLTHADSQRKCIVVSSVESSTQFKQCEGFYSPVPDSSHSNKYVSINLIMRKFSMNQYNIKKTIHM